MQNATDWAALVLAGTGIIGATLATIRWIIRNEVREVKKEFKPDGNGGHNLEGRLSRLENRVDDIYALLCKRK
jgi:hypothetical protein